MRLIDADELKRYIDDCDVCLNCKEKKLLCDIDCQMPECLTKDWERVIDEQSTIDAVPVVHAQFVKNETGVNRHCTACGAYLEDREYENHTVRFCYYCGAKMDGGKTDV